MRAPFQVIVLPYHVRDGELKFLIGKRADGAYWQAISGGGENTEGPFEAAERELYEEASLRGEHWTQLQSMCMLPKVFYEGHENWSSELFVIPEYSFMVKSQPKEVVSSEHTELKWCSVIEAESLLVYDSNKIALWEAAQRVHL